MRKRRLLLPAVLAALLVAPSVQASEPLITDPVGDAGRCTGFCTTPTVGSDPAVDITAVDVELHGQTLTFSTTVVDLGLVSTGPLAPKPDDDVTYRLTFETGSLWLGVYANRTYSHGNPTATVHAYDAGFDSSGVNAYRPAAVTFDHATSTVRIEVSLSTFNEAVAEACPNCEPIGRGTAMQRVTAATIAWITVHTGAVAGSGYLGYSNVDVTDSAGYTVGD